MLPLVLLAALLPDGAGDWWGAWGPTLVPLVVSLIALGGVIFASLWGGRKTIEAEGARSAAAIEAEKVRAALAEEAANRRALEAIDADDRRAAMLIAAEDRRHANEMRRAAREHILDNLLASYQTLETARRQLEVASLMMETVSMEDPSEPTGSLEVWARTATLPRREYDVAADAFEDAYSGVMLVGSDGVEAVCREITNHTHELALSHRALERQGSGQPEERPSLPWESSLPVITRRHGEVKRLCRQLRDVMRAEIHAATKVSDAS